jgi:xanthine dehydrogenase accessory factor
VREVLKEIEGWRAQGRSVALVTVVAAWGSAPRPTGAKMAVNDLGQMAGSVSGGCVETAVVQQALGVLRDGPPRKLHFGVSDDSAWEVGLACGGEIDLFVEPLAPLLAAAPDGSPGVFDRLAAAIAEQKPVVRAVVIEGERGLLGKTWLVGSEGSGIGSMPEEMAAAIEVPARALLSQVTPRMVEGPLAGASASVFLDVQAPSPHLVIVGGVHLAVALSRLAADLGYRVTIVEPRRAFADPERFPNVEAVVGQWPDEALQSIGLTHATAVCYRTTPNSTTRRCESRCQARRSTLAPWGARGRRSFARHACWRPGCPLRIWPGSTAQSGLT